MPEWAFLTNHAVVFSFLARHSRLTTRKFSTSVGIIERAVRKIIADMDTDGYITKKRRVGVAGIALILSYHYFPPRHFLR